MGKFILLLIATVELPKFGIILNKSSLNLFVHVFGWTDAIISLGIYLGVEFVVIEYIYICSVE
jgi:hypothetical protein